MRVDVLCNNPEEQECISDHPVFCQISQIELSRYKPNDILVFVDPNMHNISEDNRILEDINQYFLETNSRMWKKMDGIWCCKTGYIIQNILHTPTLQYVFTRLDKICAHIKQIPEILHIVLATHERNANLERVFSMLCSQTHKDIHLHLLDNNTDTELNKGIDEVIEQFHDKLCITLHRPLQNTHCIGRVLLIKDLLTKYVMEYVLIFDDDQLFASNWLKTMVLDRKPMSTLGWYGKLYSKCDYWKSTLTYKDIEWRRKPDVTRFTYFGPGGCIFDARLFLFDELYNYESYSPDIYKIDDIWMSFVFSRYLNIPFYRSFTPPNKCIDAKNLSKMTWAQLKNEKPALMKMLCDKLGWEVVKPQSMCNTLNSKYATIYAIYNTLEQYHKMKTELVRKNINACFVTDIPQESRNTMTVDENTQLTNEMLYRLDNYKYKPDMFDWRRYLNDYPAMHNWYKRHYTVVNEKQVCRHYLEKGRNQGKNAYVVNSDKPYVYNFDWKLYLNENPHIIIPKCADAFMSEWIAFSYLCE